MSTPSNPSGTPRGFEPGDRVVVVQQATHGWRHSITLTTVDKVGKRDIVLADGQRFNVSKPTKQTGDWSMPVELLHADSEQAQKLQSERAAGNRRDRARGILDNASRCLAKDSVDEAKQLLLNALAMLDAHQSPPAPPADLVGQTTYEVQIRPKASPDAEWVPSRRGLRSRDTAKDVVDSYRSDGLHDARCVRITAEVIPA